MIKFIKTIWEELWYRHTCYVCDHKIKTQVHYQSTVDGFTYLNAPCHKQCAELILRFQIEIENLRPPSAADVFRDILNK